MINRCVINFANGSWYGRGQVRLCKSMTVAGVQVFIGYTQYDEIGSPTHRQCPYAFKVHAIKKCIDAGYQQIVYADASIYAVKSWEPLFDDINRQGYYFEEAGHYAGTWTKDSVLNRFGITRDDAMKIPMYSAGFTCLDMTNNTARAFFTDWYRYACDGDSFCGTWDNKNNVMSSDPRCHGHRHDMSVASILAWKYGMKYGGGGHYLAYIGPGYSQPKDTAIAYLQPC